MSILGMHDGRAMEMLLREIEKRPQLWYSRKSFEPSWLNDWHGAVSALQTHFPEVTSKRAWKSWYFIRYNHCRNTIGSRWKPFVAFLGDPASICVTPSRERTFRNVMHEAVPQEESLNCHYEDAYSSVAYSETASTLPSTSYAPSVYSQPQENSDSFKAMLRNIWAKIERKRRSDERLNLLKREIVAALNRVADE